MINPGRLYLIPAPIAEQDPLRVLSPEVIETIRKVRHFIVESERTAGRYLSRVLSREAMSGITFSTLDEHTGQEDVPHLLERALAGEDVGLISEAGCPCVADPGSDLVAEAHRRGVRVIPLPGPSSILMALMASGFTGQKFLFLGYIPAESSARKTALKRIERDSRKDGVTRIFIEAPYRNGSMLRDALAVLDESTYLCVASSLGGCSERVHSGPISFWRRTQFELGKEPAVFLLAPRASGERDKGKSASPPDFPGRDARSNRHPVPHRRNNRCSRPSGA